MVKSLIITQYRKNITTKQKIIYLEKFQNVYNTDLKASVDYHTKYQKETVKQINNFHYKSPLNLTKFEFYNKYVLIIKHNYYNFI